MKFGKLSALAITTTLIAGAALADTAPGNNTTTTTVAPTLRDKISMGYLGIIDGPSVTNPVVSSQPDGTKIKITNQLSPAYKLNKNIGLGMLVTFEHIPVQGHTVTFKDLALRASHASLVTTDKLSLTGDVRVYLPTSSASSATNKLTALRASQAVDYKINSKWSVGSLSFIRGHFYNALPKADSLNLDFEVAPAITRQINDTTSANIAYTLDGLVKSTSGFVVDTSSLSVGMGFNPTPTLSFNPYLSVPTSDIGLKSTQIGMWMTAKVL